MGNSNNFNVTNNISTEWLEETIEKVNNINWLYKLICFLLFKRKKKLTYKEMYLLLYGLNRRNIGDKEAKQLSMERIIKIYKENNNKYPKGLEYDR